MRDDWRRHVVREVGVGQPRSASFGGWGQEYGLVVVWLARDGSSWVGRKGGAEAGKNRPVDGAN